MQPPTRREIAHRSGMGRAVTTESDVRARYDFGDFRGLMNVWMRTANILQTEQDFLQLVVEYAVDLERPMPVLRLPGGLVDGPDR